MPELTQEIIDEIKEWLNAGEKNDLCPFKYNKVCTRQKPYWVCKDYGGAQDYNKTCPCEILGKKETIKRAKQLVADWEAKA